MKMLFVISHVLRPSFLFWIPQKFATLPLIGKIENSYYQCHMSSQGRKSNYRGIFIDFYYETTQIQLHSMWPRGFWCMLDLIGGLYIFSKSHVESSQKFLVNSYHR